MLYQVHLVIREIRTVYTIQQYTVVVILKKRIYFLLFAKNSTFSNTILYIILLFDKISDILITVRTGHLNLQIQRVDVYFPCLNVFVLYTYIIYMDIAVSYLHLNLLLANVQASNLSLTFSYLLFP